MPSAGWGFSALNNNRTADFQALLYGHMATYHSRGSFHSTEQLSFRGDGYYREFLHWQDPRPTATSDTTLNKGAEVNVDAAGRDDSSPIGRSYYQAEQDISYCIASAVLAARLSRWQVVFEDMYRNRFFNPGEEPSTGTIWLGRGVPRRWFQKEGFEVTNARTSVGAVSYNLIALNTTLATYSVTVAGFTQAPPHLQATAVAWKLRWPGKFTKGSEVHCLGCAVTAVDNEQGIVAVIITPPSPPTPSENLVVHFEVSSAWF
jgi:hypothetical protein